jgi:hypothetical protein
LLLCDGFGAVVSVPWCPEWALVLKRCLARRLVRIEVDCWRQVETNVLINPGSRARCPNSANVVRTGGEGQSFSGSAEQQACELHP